MIEKRKRNRKCMKKKDKNGVMQNGGADSKQGGVVIKKKGLGLKIGRTGLDSWVMGHGF